MSSRKVVLKRKANATNLPEHVYAEAKRKIGSTFSSNGDSQTGLSFAEQKKYMPQIIGVDAGDINFMKEVKKYFHNMTVTIESTGTDLEVGTDENGEPLNLMDYIRWKFACAHPYVAQDEKEMKSNRGYKYFIYDTKIEKVKQLSGVRKRKEAYKEFIEVTSNVSKMDQLLQVYGYEPKTMDEAQKEITLEGEVEADPTQFLGYATDKNLEHQAFVNDCLTREVLRKVGNTILNGDVSLGDSMEEAILFIKDKKNSDVLTTLKARLKTFS